MEFNRGEGVIWRGDWFGQSHTPITSNNKKGRKGEVGNLPKKKRDEIFIWKVVTVRRKQLKPGQEMTRSQ